MPNLDAWMGIRTLLRRRQVDGECWIWTGAYNGVGYGVIKLPGGRRVMTHRLAAEWWLGMPVESGDFVLHQCDRPGCFNPAHLCLGSQTDNMREAAARGRLRPSALRGEAHPGARLTEMDVRAIWKWHEQGNNSSEIAREYGLHNTTVSRIVRGKAWAHLSREAEPERRKRSRTSE